MITLKNDFSINTQEQTQIIIDMLNDQEKEMILAHYIKAECDKKVFEVRKNYNDVSKFDSSNFAHKVNERLLKKVLFGSTTTETKQVVVESEPVNEPIAITKAIATKSKPTTKKVAKTAKRK